MSAIPKKTTKKGIRYTDAQKQEVIAFANKWNADNGRGGQAKATEKFGISVLTVAGWLKAAKAPKTAKAPKAGKAPKVGKAVKTPKAAKAAKTAATPAAKSAAPQSKRYTAEQKQEVVAFVLAYNSANGRGGLSAAVAKFKVSPLTISGWIQKAGVATKPAKAAKAAKVAKVKAPATGGMSAKAVIALGNQVAKVEKHFSKLKLMLSAIK